MRNSEQWTPGKFSYCAGKVRASSVEDVGSRLITNLIAGCYEEAIPKYARGRLVDLGCGAVPLYEACKPWVSEHLCADWSNSMHGMRHLDLVLNLSSALPFKDESFDTIIMSDVLEHIYNPRTIWSECNRILVEGGVFFLNVPFCYWVHEHPHDYYRYTEFALRRFAEDAGFSVLEIRAIGGSIEVMADFFAKHLMQIPLIGIFLAGILESCCAIFSRSRLGKRVISKTGKYYPIGHFMVVKKIA